VLAESGALQLKKELTDLSMLIRDTLAVFKAKTDNAGVSLTVETTDDLPWLDLDPGRIRQVASNLVANALRYIPADSLIRVRYRHAEKQALLEVQDMVPASRRMNFHTSSNVFTSRPTRAGWGWGWRLPGNWSKLTAGRSPPKAPPVRG
jgi:K+-sensing histidine kinase KdpD